MDAGWAVLLALNGVATATDFLILETEASERTRGDLADQEKLRLDGAAQLGGLH